MNYRDIFKKRMNQNGENSAVRLKNGRERNFERFLQGSPHRVSVEGEWREVDFDGGIEVVTPRYFDAVLEPYRQMETKTLMHLLTSVSEVLSIGDRLTIEDSRYLVFDWDERRGSGYNRYLLLKLSQGISWVNADGSEYESEAYIYDQTDNMLKNELKSRSRSATLYLENLKLAFMVMPAHPKMVVNSYLTVAVGDIKRSFRVTGFDFLSTPGVMYVSMDPTFERDMTPMPKKTAEDDPADFFWGGDINDS